MALWAGWLLLCTAALGGAQTLTPKQVQEKINAGGNFILIDIRSQTSFNIQTIANAIHLNWDGKQFTDNYAGKIGGNSREIIVFDQNGVESGQAAAFLKAQGYTTVEYVEGGIAAYLNNLGVRPNNPTTWGVIKVLFGNSNYRQKTI
jgi:rhodanese-related sulfurtransferase